MINPAERRTWILAEFREEIQGSYPKDLHKDGKRLCDNSWQTISQVARDRNIAIEKQAQRKKSILHHARGNSRWLRDKNPHAGFKKNSRRQKKVARMHFQRVKFVLVCPPVEKKIVAQCSVQRSASPLQSKTVSPSSTTGPGWLAT